MPDKEEVWEAIKEYAVKNKPKGGNFFVEFRVGDSGNIVAARVMQGIGKEETIL